VAVTQTVWLVKKDPAWLRTAGLGSGLSAAIAGLTLWGVLMLGVAAAGTLGRVPLAVITLTALAAFEAVADLPGPPHAAGCYTPRPEQPARPHAVPDLVISSYTPTVRALVHARNPRSADAATPTTLIVPVPDLPGAELPGVTTETTAVTTLIPDARTPPHPLLLPRPRRLGRARRQPPDPDRPRHRTADPRRHHHPEPRR
jgi:hypothetical protein